MRRELGIDPNVPVIAVVSRLNPRKGVEYFLRAVAIVAERFPDARFLIVGGSYFDPAYQPRLEKLSHDLKLTGMVTFTGERSDIMTRTTARLRQVLTLTDDDHFTLEWHQASKDGGEAKTVTMVHTRRKLQ